MNSNKKKRTPWSESPAGKEAAEFAERAKLGRPIVDESLCFICQEVPPTKLLQRGKEEFKLCDDCASAAEFENRRQNRIKAALGSGRGGDMFRMVLGANLLPTKITVKKLENPS